MGLGLAAENLRRPLGAKKPLTSLDDFRGARIELTPAQRTALRDAAQATAARSTAAAEAREKEDAALCRAGIRFTTANPAQLARLVAAVDPVYDALARDRPTARLVGEIQALKRRTAPGPGLALPGGCST